MSVPPSGTVTFLFTDVEGSTQLARQHPDTMPLALARHHALLQEAITAHHGYVFLIVGDEFEVAFPTATDALAAALAAQRALRQEFANQPTEVGDRIPSASNLQLRVRMGMHTGQAIPRGNDYEGHLTLSHTKRLMATAAGGQILLSQATEALLHDQIIPGVTLRDLGEHRLKDFDRPEHIFQVEAVDLPADFPLLKTLGASPNNLPVQLTSFIGRKGEMAEVKQLLLTTRLLTLTGSGGTGKTRLALQLAQEALPLFIDGVWLVELAPLTDPTLIYQTIAAVFELRQVPNVSLVDILNNYLRTRQLLLILDNCEHLIDACAKLSAELLHVCPQLKILASSREGLGLNGETVYRVRSLSVPGPSRLRPPDLLDYESIQLFVERATAAQPHFVFSDSNASAVAQICNRLDGIPLALELAAARVAVFSPEEIASHLDDRFRLLMGGSRAALPRHQTLRALIDWSYDLLSAEERTLFRQLSVFAGGWKFDAIEAICSDLDVLNLLTQLVNKSLVTVEEHARAGGTRYHLPETIRQYARDKLFESGEAEKARDRHLDFFLQFAEKAEPRLRRAEQLEWMERVETEHDNLRAALAWSMESGQRDRALELAGALGYFWELAGFSEGYRWLDEALSLSAREQSGTAAEKARRAKVLYAAGRIRFMSLLEPTTSRTMVEESLRLWRELGDKWWMAVALEHVGFMLTLEDPQRGLACLGEGVSLAREIDDPWPLALCLVRLGGSLAQTDVAAARRIRDEGVVVARRVGDRSILSQGLSGLAPLYQLEGKPTEAVSVCEEALAAARAIRDFVHEMLSLLQLVMISCLQSDLVKAKGYCSEALDIVRETGTSQWLLLVLLAFGLVAIFSEQPGEGVRLLVAGNTMLRQRGINLIGSGTGPFLAIFKQALEKAEAQLGPATFQAAWAEGQQMTLEQALALAVSDE